MWNLKPAEQLNTTGFWITLVPRSPEWRHSFYRINLYLASASVSYPPRNLLNAAWSLEPRRASIGLIEQVVLLIQHLAAVTRDR